MSGYAKLFSSIIHSTIWREANHVRLVWITMLAIADRHGHVAASVPGLADAARVTLTECTEALARLSAPDPYSRTKDHEGRRIVESDGGWNILNYASHRERQSTNTAKENKNDRQKRWRDKKREASTASTENEECRRLRLQKVDASASGSVFVDQGESTREGPQSTAPSPHQQVTDHYFAEFESVRGSKPIFGKAEGSAVKRLLEALKGNVTLARQVVSNALRDPYKTRETIRTIASNPDAWRVPRAFSGAAGRQQTLFVPAPVQTTAEAHREFVMPEDT